MILEANNYRRALWAFVLLFAFLGSCGIFEPDNLYRAVVTNEYVNSDYVDFYDIDIRRAGSKGEFNAYIDVEFKNRIDSVFIEHKIQGFKERFFADYYAENHASVFLSNFLMFQGDTAHFEDSYQIVYSQNREIIYYFRVERHK